MEGPTATAPGKKTPSASSHRSSAPAVSAGRRTFGGRPQPDPAFDPLYLLIPGDGSRASGRAAAAALVAARRFSVGRPVVLLDLDPAGGHLQGLVGQREAEGLAEALEFGLSLQAAGFPFESNVRIVPPGRLPASGIGALFEHTGWQRLLEGARRRGVRLLAYLPADETLPVLAPLASAAILLATPDEEVRLHARLPAELRIVGTIEPAPAPLSEVSSSQAGQDAPPDQESGAGPGPSTSSTTTPLSETDPSSSLSPRSEQSVAASPEADRSFAGIFKALTADLDIPENAAGRSRFDTAHPRPMDSERTPPRRAADGPQVEHSDGHERESEETSISEPASVPVEVRRASPGRERLVRAAAVGILAYWTLYILWRWAFTLNPEALWFSIPVALAETWAWMSAILVGVIAWRLNHRASPGPFPSPVTVDAFVLARDEPAEVIQRTAASAAGLRYPHRTWIVDTSERVEIEMMAADPGPGRPRTGYLAPPDADGNLATALNHALAATSGQFVLIVDADHAILPDALDTLLGPLSDPRVAYVQTPPDVSEVDPLGFGMDDETHRIREERRLAASLLQPGRDAHDSAILSPGCAILRRSALAEAGGFSGDDGGEMLETSLRIHAAGWKSAYLGESVAYGIGGRSAASLNREREQRARGAARTFRRYNPVTTRGLKLTQRFSYFHTLTEPVAGVQKLILYLTPAMFFFTGLLPVRALDARFLSFFVPYLLLSIAYYEVLSRGVVHTWLAQRSQMTTFWTYTKALVGSIRRGPERTSRGRPNSGDVTRKVFWPQLILMFIIALSIGWAAWAMSSGWIDYGGGWDSLSVQLNLGWAAATVILAFWVIRRGLRLQRTGHRTRFWPQVSINVEPIGAGAAAGPHPVLMDDLGTDGLSIRCVSLFPAGTQLSLDLPLQAGDLRIRGVVGEVRPEPGLPAFVHQVEFQDLPADAREPIEGFLRQISAVTGEQVSSLGAVARNEKARKGSTSRQTIRLPARVSVGDASEGSEGSGVGGQIGVLEALVPGGASLILPDAIQPGTQVVYEVPGSDLRGEGTTLYSRVLETPVGIRFRVGIRTRQEAITDR